MFSTTTYNNIFMADAESQYLASIYASTGQQDVALEWLGRLSPRIANFMGHYRVHQSAVDACLFMNSLIDELLFDLSNTNEFPDADEDFITNETILALSFILQSIPSAEDIIVSSIIRELSKQASSMDARYLRDIKEL